MKTQLNKTGIAVACAATLALLGCGGGGGGGADSSADSVATPDTTTLTVTVMDGAIEGATVCLDKYPSGLCDDAERRGKSDKDGKASFTVANADVGKYPVLVLVPKGASDADTYPDKVSLPYTMKAPKDNPTLVTPLTTLVQTQIEATGASTKDADARVQQQLGIVNSPLANFMTTGEKKAQSIANAVAVATQAQGDNVKDALNTQTASNHTITQGDLDKLVAQKVAALLDQLVSKANDAAGLEAKARVAALQPAVQTIVSTDGIKDAASAANAIDQTKQPVTPLATAVADAWVDTLRVTSAVDYYLSTLVWSAAENTADASGNLKYRYQTFKTIPGANPGDSVTQVWSGAWASEPRDEAELHWTGSAWKACGINTPSVRTVADAKGNFTFNLCDNQFTGSRNANVVDVGGKKMADVVQVIKDLNYTNLTLADPSKLGSSKFAAGANLGYFTTTPSATLTPPAYNPGGWDWAYLPDEKLAKGDPATCKLSQQPDANPSATLDQLIARERGTPCVNAQSKPTGKNGVQLDSGTRNEGWGATTLNITTLGNAPTYSKVTDASNFYTGNTMLRLSFADSNAVNYYQCQQRWDGKARNCSSIGSGGYTLETLGDGKVMRLTGLPTAFTDVKSNAPVFIERGGHVHSGYQAMSKPNKTARLNAVAANGLLAALGVNKVINPTATLTLTALSYAAEYEGKLTGTEGSAVGGSGDFWIKVSPGKAAVCSIYYSGLVSASNPSGMSDCSNFSIVPRAGDGTVADVSFTTTSNTAYKFTGTIDFYTGVVTGSFAGSDATGAWKGTIGGLRG